MYLSEKMSETRFVEPKAFHDRFEIPELKALYKYLSIKALDDKRIIEFDAREICTQWESWSHAELVNHFGLATDTDLEASHERYQDACKAGYISDLEMYSFLRSEGEATEFGPNPLQIVIYVEETDTYLVRRFLKSA